MTKPTVTSFNTIAPILIQQYERYIPNAFDESMTLLEKVNKVIQTLNTTTDTVNQVVTEWNAVMEWVMNDGLTEDVSKKLDSMVADGSLATLINEDVFAQLNDKIAQQKVDLVNQINQMSQISLKAVYNSYNEMITAKPTGDTGISLCLDTGHIYWWNDTNWQDAGAFISVPFPNDSITSHMRTKNGNFLLVESSAYLNINTTNKTLEFPSSGYTLKVNVMADSPDINPRYAGTTLDLSFGGGTGGWIYFNTDTLTFKVIYSGSGEVVGENDVFFGVVFWSTNTFFLNANYTVDGRTHFLNRSIPYKQTSYLSNRGRLLSTKKLQVNPTAKSLTFPLGGYYSMIIGNETHDLSNVLAGQTWDLSANNAQYFAYDMTDLSIKTFNSMTSINEDMCFLGYINWGTNFAVDLDFNYEIITAVGSSNITFSYNKWNGKTLNALGDSTTYGDDGSGGSNSISWVANMNQLNNFGTVYNNGVKGSTVAIQSGRSDSFVERWNSLEIADLFTILGGANDFNKNIPLGTFLSTDQTTFKGALNVIISGLTGKFPNAEIVILTPMKNNKSVGFTPSFTANGIGLKQIDYVNAIKETCDYYGIPVLDLYASSNISPFVTAQANAFMPDLLHYNQAGYLRLATKIASFIESL
jgi:lysophospholipase L1-like esterase